jgi:hypothetical protein
MTDDRSRTAGSVSGQVANILASMRSKGLSDGQIIAVFEQAPPPAEFAADWYACLAEGFAGNPEAEKWALSKRPQPHPPGNGASDSAAFRDWSAALAGIGESLANAADFGGLVESARAIPFGDRVAMRNGVSKRQREETASLLRSKILSIFSRGTASQDFNLLLIDCRKETFPEIPEPELLKQAFLACLDQGPEPSAGTSPDRDFCVAWICGDRFILASVEQVFEARVPAGMREMLAFCAHAEYRHRMSGDSREGFRLPGWADTENGSATAPAQGGPSMHRAEGTVVANIVLFLRIMVSVLGIQGYASPAIVNTVLQLAAGGKSFRERGTNSQEEYQTLISLHCQTNALSNDFLSMLMRIAAPPYLMPRASGVLGALERGRLEKIVKQLNSEGYCVFENRLPEGVCDSLMRYALAQPADLIPVKDGRPAQAVYEAGRPLAEKYNFPESGLILDPAVQALMADPTLLAVSQAYLGTVGILDLVAMWWSTAFAAGKADEDAAQLYHFDMDRLKWLKFFFYLTDVGEGTGPHCMIAKSHRAGGKPADLLNRGYVRIPDADMAAHYEKQRFMEFTAPKGSIFAVDTRAFHKGKPPTTGHRLVLEFEYANNMFGAIYKSPKFGPALDPSLARSVADFPLVYRKYL